jgi:hypothetical protein
MPNVRAFVKPTWFVQYDSLEGIEQFSRAMAAITTDNSGLHGRGTFTKNVDGSATYSGDGLSDQTINHGQYVTWDSDNISLAVTDWAALYQPSAGSGSQSYVRSAYQELPDTSV